MNFPSVRLEGSIVSADLLDAIAREDKPSQKPADFGLDSSTKVKDEIASTWASAKALWTGYQAKITNLREGQTGVSETRNLFILPLLALLGYQPEKCGRGNRKRESLTPSLIGIFLVTASHSTSWDGTTAWIKNESQAVLASRLMHSFRNISISPSTCML